MAIQSLVQPGKIPLAQIFFIIREILLQPFQDLPIIDIPQGIALEISDIISGPMHILEDPFRVIGRLHSQPCPISFIPGIPQFFCFNLSRKDIPFQLEPQDGVQADKEDDCNPFLPALPDFYAAVGYIKPVSDPLRWFHR